MRCRIVRIISTPMSLQAEETLRESIEEIWNNVVTPHVFADGDEVATALGNVSSRQSSLPHGRRINILNKSLSTMKANFNAMMTLFHEATIEEAILDEDLDDDEESDDASTVEIE